VNYSTVAQNLTGLLPVGADGQVDIQYFTPLAKTNDYPSASINHDIAIDGVVTLLTVTII
jgi:hypothetical protein